MGWIYASALSKVRDYLALRTSPAAQICGYRLESVTSLSELESAETLNCDEPHSGTPPCVLQSYVEFLKLRLAWMSIQID